ncbi:MAG: hypothetical protein OEV30_05115 [Ignavibacteria bacterium]|nr:hypothetical protein [Ignavibacteria bacterium]
MIPLLVFYIHIVFVATVFTKRWQQEGLGEGMLAVFFSALIFFVGWSMTSFLVRLIMSEGSGIIIDQDSASLLLLTGVETVFYFFYFGGNEGRGRNEQRGAGISEGQN